MVSRPGESPAQSELLSWCRERLANYKVPRYVWFTDTLPMTLRERCSSVGCATAPPTCCRPGSLAHDYTADLLRLHGARPATVSWKEQDHGSCSGEQTAASGGPRRDSPAAVHVRTRGRSRRPYYQVGLLPTTDHARPACLPNRRVRKGADPHHLPSKSKPPPPENSPPPPPPNTTSKTIHRSMRALSLHPSSPATWTPPCCPPHAPLRAPPPAPPQRFPPTKTPSRPFPAPSPPPRLATKAPPPLNPP